MNESVLSTDSFILLLAFLFIVGVLTTRFSTRLGVPSLIFFIMVGMIMGSDVLGIVYFDNAAMTQMIGVIALVIILFEGGLQTNWKDVRPVIVPSLSLATLGVLITSGIVAIAAKWILGLDWLEAILFGAIVGSTDAAAVFAVLKGHNVSPKLGSTLEAESGSNDPMAVFLTVAMIELITLPDASILKLIGDFFLQMGLGLILGIIFGRIAVKALNSINLDSSGLYPVFATAFALLTYGLTAFLNGSGLLAVYVAAIIIGNAEIAYRHSIFRFSEGFAWMMQILMFVILGLLVFPTELFSLDILIQGLLISVILMLVARPVAVFISTIKMNYSQKERIFLSWAGLKGAVPIILATFPLLAGIENSHKMFNVVFFVVLTSALIQGATIPKLADKLGLNGPKKTTPMQSLELVSLGKADAEMIEYEMESDSAIIGKTLMDIPFPEGTLVNAIIRDGKLTAPTGNTAILAGDFLYILSARKNKPQLKKLLKEKSISPENS
ncbi:potassium/proton antiporter [Mesobacillus sp. AQ2]|uniref:potassium/proton antiporter n=1 Tax=Bacillaceae TaxID=186817 RepID=UPI0011A364DC|nr:MULTISPECIES: potassium/proton antiporter [Bacillaceae]MCM3124776.1 potassium/proton antiporter [Mesobacillus sp. MER 33]MCM3232915.1 potassium/proton antiporter [Mesobacillus sp. MER 48]WHX41999.1 potassium/proton antiporter [Mesobacillus sp. AQ2]